MKMTPSIKKSLVACLFAVSTASSASVWAPNDADINLIAFNQSSSLFPSLSDTFGIFEDTVIVGTATPVVTFSGVGAVTFTQNGANYDLSSGTSSGSLLGSNDFQIGFLSGGVWRAESGNLDVGSDAQLLVFADTNEFNNLHFLYAFDVSPSSATGPVAPVPLPASIWVMTSGLLGLFFTGRRKSSANA